MRAGYHDAAWVWWRPTEETPYSRRKDGYDGWWNCSLFRREPHCVYLASDLIREAVRMALELWPRPPNGFDTYVEVAKVRSKRPGACYRIAGWRRGGWSKDGRKQRLYLPIPALVEVR